MRKRIIQGQLAALFLLILLVPKANAQTFIASFGVQHDWGVPHRVSHYINNNYYEYNWVHARRVLHHGNVEFEVILQRRNIYLQVTLDRFGHVYKTVRRDYYPLYDHVCGDYCGFHSNYYYAYYPRYHQHSHYNNVSHHRRPSGNAYGSYKNNGNGHNGSHNKGHKNEYGKWEESRGNNSSRRGESENHNRGDERSNGKREGYTKGGRGNAGGSTDNGRRATTTARRRPQ